MIYNLRFYGTSLAEQKTFALGSEFFHVVFGLYYHCILTLKFIVELNSAKHINSRRRLCISATYLLVSTYVVCRGLSAMYTKLYTVNLCPNFTERILSEMLVQSTPPPLKIES